MTKWIVRCVWAGIVLNILIALQSANAAKPIALVYQGPGSCDEDCSLASAHVAELAGFEVRYVGPYENPNVFLGADVYLQPGGVATTIGSNMTGAMKTALRNFVSAGGGYIGFCAGGYYSSLPSSGYRYLGIMNADAYSMDLDDPSMQWVTWKDGKKHHVYWEGGPQFELPKKSKARVTSLYPDGSIAGLEQEYGKGRVSVVGYHPEAPAWWRDDPPLTDQDGVDSDWKMAVEMIRWAAHL